MDQASGLSFLNVGSGSGYLSSIVSVLVGPRGSVHGVEIHANVVKWSQERFAEFSRSVTSGTIARDVRFVVGNALSIDAERNCRYDRIYCGAQGKDVDAEFFMKLLKPGGIMVGPFDDKLQLIRRAHSDDSFDSKLISRVRFAEMVRPGGSASPKGGGLVVGRATASGV